MTNLLDETFVSTIKTHKPTPVSKADALLERQAALRRVNREVPEVVELQRHADKFGSEMVVETAAELGYGFDTLVRLTDHCDRSDTELYKKTRDRSFLSGKKGTTEDRVRNLLGVEKDEDESLPGVI